VPVYVPPGGASSTATWQASSLRRSLPASPRFVAGWPFQITISQSSDDALETAPIPSAGDIGVVDHIHDVIDDQSGYRFPLPIPQGSEIISARIIVQLAAGAKNDAEGTWYCQDIDDAPTFTTASGDISNRARTTASVAWTTNDVGGIDAVVSTPDLAVCLQEVVNRAGWVEGNNAVFIYVHASNADQLTWMSWDHATALAPTLEVVWGPSTAITLAVADASQAHTADTVALTQVHQLAVADAIQSQLADNVTITAGAINLVVQDAIQAQTSDTLALTQVHSLAVADATQGQTADNLALVQQHNLAVANAAQTQIADNLAVTQVHALVVADALQGHIVDNVTLTVGGITLVVADATQSQTADSVAVAQVHQLAVADAAQGQTADSPTLTQLHLLVVANALQGQTADQVTFAGPPVIPTGEHLLVTTSEGHLLAETSDLHLLAATSDAHLLPWSSDAGAHLLTETSDPHLLVDTE